MEKSENVDGQSSAFFVSTRNYPMSRKQIRVGGVPEHFNLPWHFAIQKGVFKDLEADISFHEYPGGTGAMTAALSNGELDVALLLFEGAVSNILRGHENRIVKVYVNSPLVWGIHVAAKSSIQTVDEIQDKVYAISRAGSGSHLIAIVDAAERGWPVQEMKFSKVGNLQGAREKLKNGKVEVFLWERFITQPLVDSGEFRRVGERIVPWPAFVATVRKDLLAEQESTIHQMLKLVEVECEAFSNSPDKIDIVSDRFHMKIEDSAAWFKQLEWNFDFDCPTETTVKLIDYLEQVKIIEDNGATPADVWHSLA